VVRVYHMIERMLNAMPEEAKRQYAVLVEKLTDIQHEARGRPPHAQMLYYEKVAGLLDLYLDPEDAPWKAEVNKIYTGEA
jgi:hypothetical protein